MICFRKGSGKGFRYISEVGESVTDPKIRAYIQSLVIPPAWKNVRINTSPRAKIVVTGYDSQERKQYIYNKKFRLNQDKEKFDRIIRFADQLEHMRRVTGQHLRKRKMTREKVLATMLRLLETAFFRPGNEKYTRKNGSYGLTTLRRKHLKILNNEIIFSYIGKAGKKQERHILDGRLIKIIRELDEMPGYQIFRYVDENNQLHDVTSTHLNQYIREIMGDEFSAKDFRTWAGTVIAAMALDEIGATEENDQKKLDSNIRNAVIAVSEKLGNTPSIARTSYIDPRIIDSYIQGRTLTYFKKEVFRLLKKNENLSMQELGVLCLLKKRME
jgi:DNA topoisomerase-1